MSNSYASLPEGNLVNREKLEMVLKPTHTSGDDLRMVCDIGFTTLSVERIFLSSTLKVCFIKVVRQTPGVPATLTGQPRTDRTKPWHTSH